MPLTVMRGPLALVTPIKATREEVDAVASAHVAFLYHVNG